MIVLDASAVVELLLVTEVGRTVAHRISDPAESLHAPHLLSVEVAQVLRRLHRSGDLSTSRARQALEDLADLGIEHYSHEPFLDRMWALRSNLTAYDAAYVTIAEALDAPLLTLDARLAAAPGNRATFELLS